MAKDIKKQKFLRPGLVAFSLFFFVFPNFNVIDVFPDFIAFFLLAKAFAKLSDCVPYMEEARASFIKLGFIDLFRFFCQFFVLFAGASSQNDVMAIFVLLFSTLRLIFVFGAVRYVFEGLFYLGERTDIPALIKPFPVFGKEVSVERLRNFTLFFFIAKEIVCALPDLSRTVFGMTGKTYLAFTITMMAVSLIGGILFLILILRYIRAVKKEGKWQTGVYDIFALHLPSYNEHLKKRRLQTAFIFLFVATVFTVFLPVDTMNGAELLPTFLFPVLLVIGLSKIGLYTKLPKAILPLGILSALASLVTYILRPVYYSKFSTEDLLLNPSADALYLDLILSSVAECFITLAFLFTVLGGLSRAIETETGLPVGSPGYRQSDFDYHKNLKAMNRCFILLGCITTVARTVKTMLDYNVVATAIDGTSASSSLISYSGQYPWFIIVVNASAIFFILFSYYYTAVLKDEWRVSQD